MRFLPLRPPLPRTFATVSGAVSPTALPIPPKLDNLLLAALRRKDKINRERESLNVLVNQYTSHHNRVLSSLSLPNESRPSKSRRVYYNKNVDIVNVAHCTLDQLTGDHKITVSSGFRLNASLPDSSESLILTCAHTLEEIRWHPLHSIASLETPRLSGSFVISYTEGANPDISPITSVVSSMPRSDLLLVSSPTTSNLSALPISQYPAQDMTPVKAHFVAHHEPTEDGWCPWIVQGTWSKWVNGSVLGYRDFSGREAKPGTYDALSLLLFKPLPSPGSSGGPIVDEESGAVVGVISGTRIVNSLEGMRGCGTPSEAIFEMFALPGLEGKM